MSGLSMPVEKSQDFSGTLQRLLGRLRPEWPVLAVVLSAALVSVTLSVLGPKLLGNATTLVFEGAVGGRLPAGSTKEEAVEDLRAQGEDQLADMLSGMDFLPGSGVDFERLGQLLTLVTVVYLLSSLFGWVQGYLMAGVTQRTVYGLRAEVEGKIGRLPLKYFDTHSRGDLLSRVTNDIDNVATTLQQVLTQLVTSVLTVIGVLIMMFLISPLLALISLLAVPLSFAVTLAIARRSQKHFVAQWDWTGQLNGHVEEMYTGHDVVKVYGRQRWATDEFDRLKEHMYESSYRAQINSGIIQTAMANKLMINFHGATVPRGRRRRWPHLMTMEGVQGAEYHKWDRKPVTPEHNCTLPYTRNVVGPMDYTPVTFSAVRRTSSLAHELALSVVFESAWQHFADSPTSYRKHPAAVEFLKLVPTAWDETHFLAGRPGELVCIARRKGDAWFLGVIAAGDERTIELPLSFLGDGTYEMTLCEDNETAERFDVETKSMTGTDRLQAKLKANGGLAAHFKPN